MPHFWSINKVLAWIKKACSGSVYSLWVLQGAKVKQSVNKFNNAVETLDQSKLIQISSDGPSVNDLKFLSIINGQHDEGDHLPLIDIGTCGLHTIHESLKNWIISSGWKIDGFLRWMWNLLKESPVKMEIYKKIQLVMFAHYLITRQDGVTVSKPDNVTVIWDNAAMGKTQITVFKATLQKLCNMLLFWRK